MGPDPEFARPRTTVYELLMVTKSWEARVAKLCKLNFKLRALWRSYESKSFWTILQARTACRGITHRFSSFLLVWGPWTARELHVTEVFGWFRTDFPRAIDLYDTQTRTAALFHVTEAFVWFRMDFPRAIDSYDTQTCTDARPTIDLMWPII